MVIILLLVLCMDLSSQQAHGVAGSPMKTLEAFSLSTKEVKLISRMIRLSDILHALSTGQTGEEVQCGAKECRFGRCGDTKRQ